MNTDELIAAWALDKFRNRLDHYFRDPKGEHLRKCPTAVATPESMGWDCSCYSEYTRDDSFQTVFIISCDCGVISKLHTSDSEWSLPEFIQELDEFRADYDCPYDDEY